MTGFGKTGKHFASLHLETYPDVMCFSKALTAGLVPMSLTTCSQDIYDAFLDDAIAKGFFHAHTYSGNPLGCAAAIAGIDLLVSDEMQAHINRIEVGHHAFAKAIQNNSKVKNIRVAGVILAFELETTMERYGAKRTKLYDFFMQRGVCLRPLGNTIYIQPPYVTTAAQMDTIYEAIEAAIKEF